MPVQGSNVVVPQGREFEVLPKDVYHTQLTDIQLTTQTKYQSTEEEDVLIFIFTVIEDGENYGRQLRQYCTQKLSTYNGGSNLYKVLVGLNGGKELSKEQMLNVHVTCSDEELNKLIGRQVRLSVGQKEKQDKSGMKNTIDAFLPAKEELPAFAEKEVAEESEAEEISFDA